MSRYEVYAVRYGTFRAAKSDLYYRFHAYGEPDTEVEMAYYFYVLRSGGETVLVDTGFDPAVGERRGRTCLTPPTTALQAEGIAPSSVSTVVITHIHYDHVGNVDAFPESRLIVPAAELEFWTSPIARRTQFASHVEDREIGELVKARRHGRVTELTAERGEIAAGITAITVGGHAPAQQIIAVETEKGTVVLTSDAVHFYEELELDRPFAVMHDLERMYAAYDTLRDLASSGAYLVPGHDPEVAHRHTPGGATETSMFRIA